MMTQLGRIKGLFGRRLDELGYRTIAELVGSPEEAEGEDLDYKPEHHRQDDRAARNWPRTSPPSPIT
ncbi:hypothetical protein ACWEP4_37305 [Streptomyces sp. NPDC004227]